jgi:flagellar basal body-associated protein FliL
MTIIILIIIILLLIIIIILIIITIIIKGGENAEQDKNRFTDMDIKVKLTAPASRTDL